MEPRNPLLDDFILRLTRVKRPRVCFIRTASGDADRYIARFYRAFKPPHPRPSPRRIGIRLPSISCSADSVRFSLSMTAWLRTS